MESMGNYGRYIGYCIERQNPNADPIEKVLAIVEILKMMTGQDFLLVEAVFTKLKLHFRLTDKEVWSYRHKLDSLNKGKKQLYDEAR